MPEQLLNSLLQQIDLLTVDEQLQVVSYAAEKARRQMPTAQTCHKWRDIRGTAKHPLLGEDAQAWVTRTRRESDKEREERLGR